MNDIQNQNINLKILNVQLLHYIEKGLILTLGLILFVFRDTLTESFESGYLLLKTAIGLSIYLIAKSRKIKPLSIFFVFALTYQLNLIAFYRDLEDISGGYNIFDRLDYYNNTEWYHTLFLLCIALFFPLIKERHYFKEKFLPEKSVLFYWITLMFMAYIAVFGVSGGNIFQVGGYGKGSVEGAGGTAIFEYFLVLIPLIYFFAGRDKPLRTLASIIIIFFAIKGLALGYRNNVLQLGLMVFAMIDNPRVKYWHIMLLSLIPLYFFLIFGAIRINPLILFSDNIIDVLMEPINNFGFNLLGNQNDIFYASVRLYGFLEEGIISGSDRVVASLSNFLAIVVPYSYLPEIANLAAYKQKTYGSGGGALISMYWYLFAGIPGVIFIGSYIGFIVKKFTTSTNKYFLLYFLLVMSTYPRWFGYNQISLFKISVYGVLYFIFLNLISKIIKLSNKKYVC